VHRLKIAMGIGLALAALLVTVVAGVGRAQISPPQQVRDLLAFEVTPRDIVLPPKTGDLMREAGFERILNLLHAGQPLQALNDAYLLGTQVPAIWDEPEYHLLIAECYFHLGIDEPELQFVFAKPIYRSLMKRYPRWKNQPLVMFRLATINERQGFTIEAMANYGLLIDWYSDDLFAEQARLGLVMSSLRAGELRDMEKQALEILEISRDAQIRYHAGLGLAIARHRLGRTNEAMTEIDKTINWPEDLAFLEDFELFSVGEIMMLSGRHARAVKALLTYLERFPSGENRPMTIYYLADESRRGGQYENALIGYKYLIRSHGDSLAGLRSRLAMADLRLAAMPGTQDPITEQLLRKVREQNDYEELKQRAALVLGQYFADIRQPLMAIRELTEVFDNPYDIAFATRALNLMLECFTYYIETKQDQPLLVAEVFGKYRSYIDVPAAPVRLYDELGKILYQNLQADTLASISGGNPMAQTYPKRAALFSARAHELRGETDKAIADLERLIKMIAQDNGEEKHPLRYQGRMLWAQLEKRRGKLRNALRQIGMARNDAEGRLQEGLLEMEAGVILLRDNGAGAAAGRLQNAVQLFGEPTDKEPLRQYQLEALFNLGEALYQARRYAESGDAFARLLAMQPEDYRSRMAQVRMAQIRRERGETAVAEPDKMTAENAPTKWFWPRGEWSWLSYLNWLDHNESRFSDEPDWERLQ